MTQSSERQYLTGCLKILIKKTRGIILSMQRRMISVDNFFVFLILLIFCFVVAICDLVHNVKTIFYLFYVLTASGNLF